MLRRRNLLLANKNYPEKKSRNLKEVLKTIGEEIKKFATETYALELLPWRTKMRRYCERFTPISNSHSEKKKVGFFSKIRLY